jgi:hypothetical protein
VRKQRDLGAFYTPAETADLMVGLLDIGRGDRVLDPAAGDGALVAALVRAGVPPERITAWDVDPAACAHLRARFPDVTVEQRDTLLDDTVGNGSGRWERILANPPYLNKASAYVRENRAALKRRFGPDYGAGETYAMFLHVALGLAEPDGAVVLITSDTIRTLRSHERLRRRIVERHHLRTLVETPPRLFRGASVGAVILDIRLRGSGPTRVVRDRTTVAATPISPGILCQIEGTPFPLSAPESVVALFGQPGRLSDRVRGHIGMHTRDNRRRVAALEGTRLADHYERRRQRPGEHPVVSATEALSARWRPYLKEGGDKDFHHPVTEFVDWRDEARAGYVIPDGGLFGQPGICVSGVSRRLSARVMPPGCHWDSNKVIGLVPHDPGDTNLLVGLLNSDLYTFLAKHLLNDTSSVQLSDLMRLPLPEIADNDRRRIAGLAAQAVALRERDPSADLRDVGTALDEAVYEALGITAADRSAVRAELAHRGRQRR